MYNNDKYKRFNIPLVTSNLITLAICAALLVTCGQTDSHKQAYDGRPDSQSIFSVSPAFASVATQDGASIADVAERTVASVVNISTTRSARHTQGPGNPHGPMLDDPFFRHFFGGPRGRAPRPFKQDSLGSGVIVSADGVVLTNNHVVQRADEIRVTLADGREFDARIEGTDEKSDLAVLRLEGDVENLSPLPVGDSSRLRLGDVVLAIGNPFGVGQTVTMGIVSAKGRSRMGIVDYEDFIQTDAAINPGNSGGALVDMRGQLVGINTAILSRSGGYQGIGFAIPMDMAGPIAESLLEHGKVVRGWLGVGIQDLDPALSKGLGLSVEKGVLVSSVGEDSPAARAGIERGDVIVEFDGEAMDSTTELRNRVASAGPDKRIDVVLLRGDERKTLTVTLGTLADVSASSSGPVETREGVLSGIAVTEPSAKARERYGLPADLDKGVVVTSLEPDSAAARAGLRPGDLILEVDKKPVDTTAAFRERARAADSSAVLLVWRGGNTVYLLIRE